MPTVTIWHGDDQFVIDATLHPGDPGRYSGPPEHCYPEEPPEVEVHSVIKNGADFEGDLPQWVDDELFERLAAIEPPEPDYDD